MTKNGKIYFAQPFMYKTMTLLDINGMHAGICMEGGGEFAACFNIFQMNSLQILEL